MAKNLINGCSYSEIWVHPKNWQSVQGKKAASLDWYIECKFYDPRFTKKYPKGFPYRKKLNRITSVSDRRDKIRSLLFEIPYLFEELHYNPIPSIQGYMKPLEPSSSKHVTPESPVQDALLYGLSKIPGQKKHLNDARLAVNRVNKAFASRAPIAIKDLRYSVFSDTIDSLRLTAHSFNHYREFFVAIFRVLIKNECCVQNWAAMLDKRKVVRKPREILNDDQFQKVMQHLKEKYYTFYRYSMLFFLSGTRTTELLSIKKRDVRLQSQEYDVLVQKGRSRCIETKVILPEAIPYWSELLEKAHNDDYLISTGLEPGPVQLQPRRISDRWRTHVKEPLKVTADFYALKHKFLDMIDAKQSAPTIDESVMNAINNLDVDDLTKIKLLASLRSSPSFDMAQKMAAHRSSGITNKVYKVGREKREREELKKLIVGINKS